MKFYLKNKNSIFSAISNLLFRISSKITLHFLIPNIKIKNFFTFVILYLFYNKVIFKLR